MRLSIAPFACSAQLPSSYHMEEYEAEINALDRKIKAGYEPDELPGYLDSGGSADIVRIADGTRVVKIPHPVSEKGETPQEVVRRYITAYQRCKGYVNLEQMCAYRTGTCPRVVCQYVTGKVFEDMTASERSAITARDFRTLFDTYKLLPDLGVEDDQSVRNLIYSPANGFTIIDYEAAELASKHFTSEERIAGFATEVLVHGLKPGYQTPNYVHLAYETVLSQLGSDIGRVIAARWSKSGFRLQ